MEFIPQRSRKFKVILKKKDSECQQKLSPKRVVVVKTLKDKNKTVYIMLSSTEK